MKEQLGWTPSLELHEFFHKYANTPLEQRGTILDMIKYGTTTLNSIYVRLKGIEEELRPKIIERDDLLAIATEGLKNLKKI